MSCRGVICLLLIATILCGLRAQEVAPPVDGVLKVDRPKIVFEQIEIDLGQIKQGEQKAFAFKFRNEGKAPLQILQVKPGCGCTSIAGWERNIPPGDAGELRFSLVTASMSGALRKPIDLVTNIPEQEELRLWVSATVFRTFILNPPDLAFGKLEPDRHKTISITITRNLKEPARIVRVISTSETFTPELIDQGEGQYELKVTARPPFVEGNNMGTIQLEYEGMTEPLQIQASAFLPSPVAVVPQRIFFTRVPLASVEKRRLSIVCQDERTIDPPEAVASDPSIKLSVEENVPGKQYTVQLEFPMGFDIPHGKNTTIELKTTHPHLPSMQVDCVPFRRNTPKPATTEP